MPCPWGQTCLFWKHLKCIHKLSINGGKKQSWVWPLPLGGGGGVTAGSADGSRIHPSFKWAYLHLLLYSALLVGNYFSHSAMGHVWHLISDINLSPLSSLLNSLHNQVLLPGGRQPGGSLRRVSKEMQAIEQDTVGLFDLSSWWKWSLCSEFWF